MHGDRRNERRHTLALPQTTGTTSEKTDYFGRFQVLSRTEIRFEETTTVRSLQCCILMGNRNESEWGQGVVEWGAGRHVTTNWERIRAFRFANASGRFPHLHIHPDRSKAAGLGGSKCATPEPLGVGRGLCNWECGHWSSPPRDHSCGEQRRQRGDAPSQRHPLGGELGVLAME